MVKNNINNLLKSRMAATHEASELQECNQAYLTIIGNSLGNDKPRFCDLPVESLLPFHTADIGFKPYPRSSLQIKSQEEID